MVAGAAALQRRSMPLAVIACLAALAALLSHTLQALLFPGLLLAILNSSLAERRLAPWHLLLIVGAANLAAAGVFVVYLLPLARGWNASGAWWGYSVSHSVLASVNQ